MNVEMSCRLKTFMRY